MPWRETSVMEERLRFVARLLEGEGMSDVCREFVIRNVGPSVVQRFQHLRAKPSVVSFTAREKFKWQRTLIGRPGE